MATDELLQGHHALGFIKSAALLCAMELGIPDAIVRCGGAGTLDDLVTATKLPPANLPFLHHLMRALTVSGIFAVPLSSSFRRKGETTVAAASIPVYEFTAASRLLLTSAEGFSLFPSIKSIIKPEHVSAILGMHDRMKDESASSAMDIFTMAGVKDV